MDLNQKINTNEKKNKIKRLNVSMEYIHTSLLGDTLKKKENVASATAAAAAGLSWPTP